VPVSQRIWAVLVLCLGFIWTFGGLLGALHGAWQMWLMFVLGIGLLRLGYNLGHPGGTDEPH